MPGRHILPIIVLAQIAGGSLWFSGNAALADLQHRWPDVAGAVGWLTSAVQLGFIAGTLLYALLGLADRHPAHRLFFVSAVLGASANAAALLVLDHFAVFLVSRFLTGVFLAGIYPVGMKLAASWYRGGLGAAMGLLVGALVLGTALPHLLAAWSLDPVTLIGAASVLALGGGLVILVAVPEGPGVTRASTSRLSDAWSVFSDRGFRSAACGYFGHMWELYALWAFVPFALRLVDPSADADTIAGRAFAVVGVGFFGCALGGLASRRIGSARVAAVQLVVSAACCVASPFVLAAASPRVGLAFLVVWGVTVVGDSPQFSAIAAACAPRDRVGTGLTIMTAIGFALTIPAIQLLTALSERVPPHLLFLVLAPGPLLGLFALRPALSYDDPS